jgi:hypothetical protein
LSIFDEWLMELLLPPDFREFLQLLNSDQIDYLIVGGYAVGFRFPALCSLSATREESMPRSMACGSV